MQPVREKLCALRICKIREIVFEHVGFSYVGDAGKLCLSDIDLRIESGETIGIIGGTAP